MEGNEDDLLKDSGPVQPEIASSDVCYAKFGVMQEIEIESELIFI